MTVHQFSCFYYKVSGSFINMGWPYWMWRPSWKYSIFCDASNANINQHIKTDMCTDFHAFTTKCQVASLIWVGHIGFGGHLENCAFFATPPTLILISIWRSICVPIFMLLLKSARSNHPSAGLVRRMGDTKGPNRALLSKSMKIGTHILLDMLINIRYGGVAKNAEFWRWRPNSMWRTHINLTTGHFVVKA